MIKFAILMIFAVNSFANSIDEEIWYPMPDGKLYHIECIHQYDDEFSIQTENGVTKVTLGDQIHYHTPCPHKPRLQYYSNWSIYVQTVHKEGFSSMYSEMKVPSKPKTRGPTGLGSVYFFNGLEDGSGIHGKASLILQPVLQYGRSGCLINPIKYGYWWLTSYMVNQSGRAYCGPNLGPLTEGELLGANMTLVNQETGEWLIESTRMKNNQVSSTTVLLPNITLDAAYLTLEGMVIYGCQQFPDSNHIEFSNNKLKDMNGQNIKPQWSKILNHGECQQDAQIGDNGENVNLTWDNSISNIQIDK